MMFTLSRTAPAPATTTTNRRTSRRKTSSPTVVAAKRPNDDDDDGGSKKPASGFPSASSSAGSSRGPGSAPLRMETQEQRKFGYGGDGLPPDDDDDEEAWDDGWNPGGEGAPSAWGLVILLVVGAWALWEYKRPGGSLNPETKRLAQRRRYERAYKLKYGHLPGERPISGSGGSSGTISGL